MGELSGSSFTLAALPFAGIDAPSSFRGALPSDLRPLSFDFAELSFRLPASALEPPPLPDFESAFPSPFDSPLPSPFVLFSESVLFDCLASSCFASDRESVAFFGASPFAFDPSDFDLLVALGVAPPASDFRLELSLFTFPCACSGFTLPPGEGAGLEVALSDRLSESDLALPPVRAASTSLRRTFPPALGTGENFAAFQSPLPVFPPVASGRLLAETGFSSSAAVRDCLAAGDALGAGEDARFVGSLSLSCAAFLPRRLERRSAKSLSGRTNSFSGLGNGRISDSCWRVKKLRRSEEE